METRGRKCGFRFTNPEWKLHYSKHVALLVWEVAPLPRNRVSHLLGARWLESMVMPQCQVANE